MRKRNKKQRDAASDASRSTDSSPSIDKKKKDTGGSFIRRMGSIGKRRTEVGEGSSPPPQPETAESTIEGPPTPPPETDAPPETQDAAVAPVAPVSPIAVEHPVATRPFTKAAWKKRSSEPEMEKPVEEPSPESALKRRIAFVAQASACFSEDHDDGEEGVGRGEVGSLEEAVALARVRLAVQSPPSPAHSRDDDTEEEGYTDAMPAYGDLIEPESKAGPEPAPSNASPSAERREHLYKILVIGELGTGKTSIIKRYVHQFFSQHYRATIGVDFALKVLNWDANTIIRLQLWDIAGQERFGNMTRVYYKEAVGAFIVFDVSRVATFDAVVKWKNDLDTKVQLPDGSPIPCILLANKCDQQKEGLVNSPAKMDEYCREKGFAGWFETSAKENINIEEAARSLVNKILLNDKLLQSSDSKDADRFGLEHKIANGENSRASANKSCAC
ncbi:EF-hand calcium-binding domain-containing protein 4B isoform X1 [Ostrinia nubilalis]|uniref:EF-hand calcium-binding domain-containing protein 4B isoform X1 n=1 Tax=Ostrinia nubilalis TaxID=29057 RepID=UPI00308223BA